MRRMIGRDDKSGFWRYLFFTNGSFDFGDFKRSRKTLVHLRETFVSILLQKILLKNSLFLGILAAHVYG
jgi:hypothetical protein